MRKHNCICVVCGVEHYQRPKDIKNNKNGLCCSIECSKKNRSNYMTGKNNHQFGVKGSKNSSFKGNRKISRYGYVLIYKPKHKRANHAGYVWEHLLVMEKHIGRSLLYFGKQHKNNEVCHHINQDKQDNRIENLELMTLGEHTQLHQELDIERARKAGKTKSVISDKEAENIRKMYKTTNKSQQSIAQEFGVSQSVISNIINKRRYCYGK